MKFKNYQTVFLYTLAVIFLSSCDSSSTSYNIEDNGNDSGGGQPGWVLKCKGWEDDPDSYVYFITQAPVWDKICNVIGRDDLISDPEYSTPKARLDKLSHIFETIEKWTMTKTKFEVVSICDPLGIPCGPILSMKEIAHDESLRRTGTVVEVDHPERGKYITVGCPIKLSNSFVASIAIAPAPSPNKIQLFLSFQST